MGAACFAGVVNSATSKFNTVHGVTQSHSVSFAHQKVKDWSCPGCAYHWTTNHWTGLDWNRKICVYVLWYAVTAKLFPGVFLYLSELPQT